MVGLGLGLAHLLLAGNHMGCQRYALYGLLYSSTVDFIRPFRPPISSVLHETSTGVRNRLFIRRSTGMRKGESYVASCLYVNHHIDHNYTQGINKSLSVSNRTNLRPSCRCLSGSPPCYAAYRRLDPSSSLKLGRKIRRSARFRVVVAGCRGSVFCCRRQLATAKVYGRRARESTARRARNDDDVDIRQFVPLRSGTPRPGAPVDRRSATRPSATLVTNENRHEITASLAVYSSGPHDIWTVKIGLRLGLGI